MQMKEVDLDVRTAGVQDQIYQVEKMANTFKNHVDEMRNIVGTHY